jgi:hypothetical protein
MLIHLIGAALVCTPLATWTIRLTAPLPGIETAKPHSNVQLDPDPILLGRAFGQIEAAAPSVLKGVQVDGVYAAGQESAAVFTVGDRSATVRLGQEVAPGSTLIEVEPQSVTLDSGGVRRQLRLPTLPIAAPASPVLALRGAAVQRRAASALHPATAQHLARAVGGGSSAVVLARPEPRPEPKPEAASNPF